MNGDALFRGRLNGRDQVPPGKRSSGFYFEGLFHDQAEDAPRLKTEFRMAQRRLLDELDDVEDERDDTVEGDDILQVLLRANRPRAGRRRLTEDQRPHFVRELSDVPPCYSNREETTGTVILESERQDEDRDGSYEKISPLSWPLVAHWVGTLLLGISIVLTWPIGLAYFRG